MEAAEVGEGPEGREVDVGEGPEVADGEMVEGGAGGRDGEGGVRGELGEVEAAKVRHSTDGERRELVGRRERESDYATIISWLSSSAVIVEAHRDSPASPFTASFQQCNAAGLRTASKTEGALAG